MIWHIIVRFGEDDSFMPSINNDEPRIFCDLNKNSDFKMREHILYKIQEDTGNMPSEELIDFYSLAMATQTADSLVFRAKYSVNGWARQFKLYLPVSNVSKWKFLIPLVSEMLGFLSGDQWKFELRKRKNLDLKKSKRKPTLSSNFDLICLFSGGLDSCIGAIDLLEKGKKILLVGHYKDGVTSTKQQDVFEYLYKRYSDNAVGSFNFVQITKYTRFIIIY